MLEAVSNICYYIIIITVVVCFQSARIQFTKSDKSCINDNNDDDNDSVYLKCYVICPGPLAVHTILIRLQFIF